MVPVTDGAPQDPPPPQPETQKISPEDLAQMLAASERTTPSGPAPMINSGAMRRKLLIAVLIAAIGLGASIMSCVGQSFSYRQARALEGIEQQLKAIRAGCTKSP
jgi:hypothetical protein